MESHGKTVDVIALCHADGSIRPLRLRLEDQEQHFFRIDIEEILSTKEIPYVGIEALIFCCRGRTGDHTSTFRLKYLFRSHTWQLV